MDQISCPVCNRDYELPRRHMKTYDDFDYLPIPRMLSCLHTVCHSCLETQRESNEIGQICCPICKKSDIVKGIRFMPLDITTLKHIADVNSTEIMSMCCKCYEDVPSVSWCDTCSSALCEFHYTDHKMSFDSSKHKVNTMKEIAFNNLHIEYKFPPISCPEALMCDCSLYCHDCMYLISSDAMIAHHRNHNVDNYETTAGPMKETVNKTINQAKKNNSLLERNINDIRGTLQALDMHEEDSAAHITKMINKLHRFLKKRETTLLEQLQTSVAAKRTVLVDQLSSFTEIYEDSKHVLQTCELLLENTKQHQHDAMYMIAATETVDFRGGDITEVVAEKCRNRIKINPEIRSEFIEYELQSIANLIHTLGSVQFVNESLPPTPPMTPLDASETLAESPKICFNLKIDDSGSKPPSASAHNSNTTTMNIGSTINSHSSSGGGVGGQLLTIEARLLPSSSADYSAVESSAEKSTKSGKMVSTIPTSAGVLLGKVELSVNIDRRLLASSKHTLNSYFESCMVNKLPVMKISRELLSSQQFSGVK